MNQFADALKQNLTPVYVEQFDLSCHPFSSQFSTNLYYETEERKILAKKIAHLLDFTKLILFIQSEKGAGKTTLLRQRMRQAKDNWRVCFINAKDFTTPDSLVTKISADLEVKFHNVVNNVDNLDLLREQLSAMRQTGLNPILFIDDIEQLSESIIATLATLIQYTPETQPNLRLLISGLDVTPALRQIIPKDDKESALKYLPLSPLTEIESAEYIKHRLRVSNYQYLEPFSKIQLKKIHINAKGLPAQINKLADLLFTQYALDCENSKPLIRLNENINKRLKYVAVGLSALILLIIIFSLFDKNDSEIELVDTDSHIQELRIPAIPEKQDAELAVELEKKSHLSADKNTQENASIAPTTPEKIEPVVKRATTESLKAATQTAQKETATITESKNKIEEKPKLNETRIKATKKDSNWIRRQNPRHYTLQLISGGNKVATKEFIKEHNIGKDATVFHSIHKGRNWYSVIYKSFSSEKAAKEGEKSLPGSLKKIKPWMRTFSTIQKIMK